MNSMRKYLAIIALSLSGGSIYFIPYMRYTFQTPMLEAFNCTNEQLGFMLSAYAACSMILYIPGGMLADRLSPKKTLVISLLATSALGGILAATLSYKIAMVVWFLFAFSSNFVFWTSLIKAIRMVGTADEQGKVFGLYYSGNGLVNTVVGFLTVAVFGFVSKSMNDVEGVRWVILTSVGIMALAALAVALFFKDNASSTAGEDEEKFSLKSVGPLVKNPLVWVIAFTVFCAYGFYTSSSYFVPYMTDVMGVSVETSATLGVIRQSVFLLVCAPLGGFIADKLKSTSKWFMMGYVLLAASFLTFYFMPTDANLGFAIFVSLIPAALALMVYGITWSIMEECKVPRRITGIVVGLASIIGYSPDLFFNALFGRWIDVYAAQGYRYIFLFLTALAIVGFVLATIIRKATYGKTAEQIGFK